MKRTEMTMTNGKAIKAADGPAQTKSGRAAQGAIVGRREQQEDASAIVPFAGADGKPRELLILADGMGGHVGGVEASRIAVRNFADAFLAADGVIAARLRKGMESANQGIGEAIVRDPSLKGMGCTLIGAVIDAGQVNWISVGDSLLLEISPSRIKRLNAVHSLAEQIDREVELGIRTKESAANDPQRHMLLSAVMGGKIALIDEGRFALSPGSLLLLASDGIETLSLDQIKAECPAGADPQTAISRLLRKIESAMPPEQDNTTIVACQSSGGSLPNARVNMDAKKILLLVFAVIGLSVAASALTWIFLGSTDNDDKGQAESVTPSQSGEEAAQQSPAVTETANVEGNAKPAIDPKAAITDANREANGGSKPAAKPAPKAAPAPAPARPVAGPPKSQVKPAQNSAAPTPVVSKPPEKPADTGPKIVPERITPAPKLRDPGA